MKVDDRMDFVATMEKEITDHKRRGHWTIVDKASLPFNGIHHISYQNEVNTNKVFTKCQSIEDNGRLDVTSVMNIYIFRTTNNVDIGTLFQIIFANNTNWKNQRQFRRTLHSQNE